MNVEHAARKLKRGRKSQPQRETRRKFLKASYHLTYLHHPPSLFASANAQRASFNSPSALDARIMEMGKGRWAREGISPRHYSPVLKFQDGGHTEMLRGPDTVSYRLSSALSKRQATSKTTRAMIFKVYTSWRGGYASKFIAVVVSLRAQ